MTFISAKTAEQFKAAGVEFLRVFVATALSAYLTQITMDGKLEYPTMVVLLAAVTAAIPVLIRALSKSDGEFGRGYVPSWQATVADNDDVAEIPDTDGE